MKATNTPPHDSQNLPVTPSFSCGRYFRIIKLEQPEGAIFSDNSGISPIPTFSIFWLISGEGCIYLKDRSRIIHPLRAYSITSGLRWQARLTGNTSGFLLSFSPFFMKTGEIKDAGALLIRQFEASFQDLISEIDIDPNSEMADIIERIYKEYSNYYELRLQILQGLLNIFLIYFARKRGVSEVKSLNKEHEIVSTFLDLVRKHFQDRKMVADYAAELNLTPNYLNRLVKKVTGFTASHHIQQQVLAEAKKYAIYSSSPMKQIAYSLGFENVFHFSRFFKTNTGINFSDFKREHLLS